MATLQGNDQYISVNSSVVTTTYRSFSMELATDQEDTSAGTGIEWASRGAKLSTITATLTIVHDTGTVSSTLDTILNSVGRGDVVPVVFGPEGNTAGQPKHDQDFLVTGITGPETGHDKPLVTYEISMESSGAPRSNMYDGDTW
jgi:hypothetical protein